MHFLIVVLTLLLSLTHALANVSYSAWDHKDAKLVLIKEEDLESAILDGRYTLQKDTEVPVVSPEGQAGTVPSENIYKALETGFKIELSGERALRVAAAAEIKKQSYLQRYNRNAFAVGEWIGRLLTLSLFAIFVFYLYRRFKRNPQKNRDLLADDEHRGDTIVVTDYKNISNQ